MPGCNDYSPPTLQAPVEAQPHHAPQPIAVAVKQGGQRALIALPDARQENVSLTRFVGHTGPHEMITAARRRLYTGEEDYLRLLDGLSQSDFFSPATGETGAPAGRLDAQVCFAFGGLSMKRFAVGLVALLILAVASGAQPQPSEPIALTLHPAAPPKPSLKYRLLPDRREQQPGNAAALYYRALAMFVENQTLLREIQSEYWSNWRALPLKQLPRQEIQEKLRMARHLLAELQQAALRRDCDWQLEGRSEGFGLLLPELNGYRRVAEVIAVQARLEIAEGQFDKALQALQTGYALAHRLGEGPTLIHTLVGAAVASVLNDQLQELIQQPCAPNLYW